MKKTLTNIIFCTALSSLYCCNYLKANENALGTNDSISIFEYREIYLPEHNTKANKELGLNSMDDDWGLWGHNLDNVLPHSPSQTIYAKVGNNTMHEQFCFTSDHLYEYIEAYIDDKYGERHTNRFAILPNDNNVVCMCKNCKAAGNTPQDASPAVLHLIKRLAERFPNHLFFTSYYQTTRSIPKDSLPENAGVLISTMDYPLSAVSTTQELEFEELLLAWAKKTEHVYIWDYINNFDDYFTPFPVFEAMQRRFQIYAGAGVRGIFLNGSGTDYSTLSRLKFHVLAALMKNPETEWRPILDSLCHDFYPVTGNAISQFMQAQEDYVAKQARPLPLYEGVAKALSTYLPESAFMAFHDTLQTLLPRTTADEQKDIDKLCKALALTRLELMRLHDNVNGSRSMLPQLSSLKNYEIDVYNEASWTIESYVKDYEYMYRHAENVGKENLLKGIALTPLTPLDPDYSDISILTDGMLGLPSNYHCGQLISSAEFLRIAIPHVAGMKRLRVCLTRNQLYHIHRPLSVSLSIGGVNMGKVEPHLATDHSGHAFAEFNIPASHEGTLVVTLERNPEEKTMAIDEIEGLR